MAEHIPGGYNGRILRVNLTNKTTASEQIDELFCRKYIGGAGFVLYYLWKELQQGIDPLGPDNKLVFALGPVTGVPLPGSGRHRLSPGGRPALRASLLHRCSRLLRDPLASPFACFSCQVFQHRNRIITRIRRPDHRAPRPWTRTKTTTGIRPSRYT